MVGRRLAWDEIVKGKGVPRRPYLHPTRGHVGQNAPKKVLSGLSGPEGDVSETVRRFARATRRQPVEHMGLIHPLSGRLMGMARGHEIGVAPPVVRRKTGQRLAQIAQHHSEKAFDHSMNGEEALAEHHMKIAQRASDAVSHTGRAAGPRPIVIHNHPTFHGGGTRHQPSALDMAGTTQAQIQSRVVSLKPHARRGEAKSIVTSFGHHGDVTNSTNRHLQQLARHDQATTPPGLIHQLRQGKIKPITPLQARMAGMGHVDAAEAQHEAAADASYSVQAHRARRLAADRKAGRAPRGSDYDSRLAALKPKRKGGYYTRQQMMKRYEGPRRVAPSAVGKRLVDEERHTSIPRLLAAGTGMGAIAWGGSRFRTLGRGLRLGATHPDIKVGIRRAFNTAELARSSTERATRPLGAAAGRGYGHLPANVRASLNNVPPGLRPATSALVGAIMVENARPVRRTTYRPVVID